MKACICSVRTCMKEITEVLQGWPVLQKSIYGLIEHPESIPVHRRLRWNGKNVQLCNIWLPSQWQRFSRARHQQNILESSVCECVINTRLISNYPYPSMVHFFTCQTHRANHASPRVSREAEGGNIEPQDWLFLKSHNFDCMISVMWWKL